MKEGTQNVARVLDVDRNRTEIVDGAMGMQEYVLGLTQNRVKIRAV
jgi:hypothetical protein